ncbi:unnamed protein product [Rotaria socialis]|uniref:Uncharacterized protein n=1 Tax=Rotaria socialis TaxID=392032 RepID=A0A820JWE7_9BILA|nr:unnamed protein product [Rotaria socialis]CAF4330494.1 unnamed protein product [Rotaria socialis]CAF4870553.1 unnamed protein product [Rotaria socialis]
MADLWGALEEIEPGTSPTVTVAIRTPDVTVVQDLINHDKIQRETEQLRQSMNYSAQIVIAAYKVADYVPNLENSEHRQFWQSEVIPTLVKSLDQDVKARSVVMESFSSVRDLAISIKNGAELVKLRDICLGSPAAVAAAQRTVSAALNDLNKSIEKAESIKSSALNEFAGQTEKLLKIMGPETAKYTEERVKIGDQLRKEYEKEEKFHAEIAHKKGEMERYSHLMHATQNRAKGSLAALNETKNRTKEMMSLNEKLEKTIQNIAASIPKTETSTNIERSAWLPWRKTTSTSTKSFMIENPNRVVEKNYYESMVLSRMSRIREHQKQEMAEESVLNDLERCLSDYKAKYKIIVNELEEYEKLLPIKIAESEREIIRLNELLIDIDKGVTDATNIYGHHGDTLVRCLAEIKCLAKAINNGATAYTPLVGVLKGRLKYNLSYVILVKYAFFSFIHYSAVKASVDAQIELLMSKDPNDIFLGGSQLLRQVECLGHYHTCASVCLEPPQEYQNIAVTTRVQAIEMS